MLAEIITIGDEILIGQIVDTNSVFIAKELNKIGVSVYQISSIQDDKEHILNALKEASSRVQVVLITGGLGPTKDDITKHTLCEYFEDSLVQNTAVLEHVKRLFLKHDIPLHKMNKNQALVPSKATVLPNNFGTAPGMWISNNNTLYVSLPGVPHEMKNLITQDVYKRQAKGADKEELQNHLEKELAKLYPLINDYIYGTEDDQGLEEVIAGLLTSKKMTLSTAESFTGGQIAKNLTAIAGASSYFKGSIVSYATETKVQVLGVSKKTVEEHSVVSTAVVEEMASSVKHILNTDFAIATTGNAGPSKGDSTEDVGTVFIAIASPDGVISEKFHMGTPRERVVQKSVNKAFEMLQKEILKF